MVLPFFNQVTKWIMNIRLILVIGNCSVMWSYDIKKLYM